MRGWKKTGYIHTIMNNGTWSYGCFFHFLIHVSASSNAVSRYGKIYFSKQKLELLNIFLFPLNKQPFVQSPISCITTEKFKQGLNILRHKIKLIISENGIWTFPWSYLFNQCCESMIFWRGYGSWIRILLFSSLTFKMPTKN
jgi:hypothetical protein